MCVCQGVTWRHDTIATFAAADYTRSRVCSVGVPGYHGHQRPTHAPEGRGDASSDNDEPRARARNDGDQRIVTAAAAAAVISGRRLSLALPRSNTVEEFQILM